MPTQGGTKLLFIYKQEREGGPLHPPSRSLLLFIPLHCIMCFPFQWLAAVGQRPLSVPTYHHSSLQYGSPKEITT